jgi:flagellin
VAIIGILSNIASLDAQNQLSITQNNLNNTLEQLSSGSRINSGSDDAAGLAIANGLEANVTALTQSAQNASSGIGTLQVADGSLAEVTQLLDRAVTLATESANGGISASQRTAINTEYQSINQEITSIGTSTNYNGAPVFSATPTSIYLSDGVSSSTIGTVTSPLTAASLGLVAGTVTQTTPAVAATGTISFSGTGAAAGDAIVVGGTTYTFQSAAAGTGGTSTTGVVQETGSSTADAANLANAINFSGGTVGTDYGSGGAANATFTAVASGNVVTITAITPGTGGNNATLTTTNSNGNVALTATAGGTAAVTTHPNLTNDLLTAADSQATLGLINAAVATVASLRGTIGASVNRLTAAGNVITNQVQNLTSAENNITAANIPQVVANLSSYSILDQSGISALAQANTAQQNILALLR